MRVRHVVVARCKPEPFPSGGWHSAAAGGGFVIGTASISGDVSVATFEYLVELLDELDPYR